MYLVATKECNPPECHWPVRVMIDDENEIINNWNIRFGCVLVTIQKFKTNKVPNLNFKSGTTTLRLALAFFFAFGSDEIIKKVAADHNIPRQILPNVLARYF